MPVGADQHVGFLHVLLTLRSLGMTGNPRIDVEGLRFRRLDSEGSVAKPRQLDSLKIQETPPGDGRISILVTRAEARNQRTPASGDIGLDLNSFGCVQTRV